MGGFFEMPSEDLKKAVFDGLTPTRERLTAMPECLKWVVES